MRRIKFAVQHLLESLNPCFNGRYSLSMPDGSMRYFSGSLNPCFNGRYSLREPQWRKVKVFGCLNPCFNGRYSLSAADFADYLRFPGVLILVLMEDTHWEISRTVILNLVRLNPCFNGRYSLRWDVAELNDDGFSLNPCFNGRYSLRGSNDITAALVGLNPCFNGRYSLSLILFILLIIKLLSLNPCFNGRYSLRKTLRKKLMLY